MNIKLNKVIAGTVTKLALSSSQSVSIPDDVIIHQVLDLDEETESFDLTNGDHIQGCRNGKYFNREGDPYEGLYLGIFDLEGKPKSGIFLGFLKMNEIKIEDSDNRK